LEIFIYTNKLIKKKIMKKIVRLTESDLVRLVKRVLSEQMSKLTPENSMVGKTFKWDSKTCVIEKAFKLPNDGGFLVLPKEGCRKNNGIVDGVPGYVYMSRINGGSLMTGFEWKGDNWVYEPSYSQANVNIF
jgi:hypothetical protein